MTEAFLKKELYYEHSKNQSNPGYDNQRYGP